MDSRRDIIEQLVDEFEWARIRGTPWAFASKAEVRCIRCEAMVVVVEKDISHIEDVLSDHDVYHSDEHPHTHDIGNPLPV